MSERRWISERRSMLAPWSTLVCSLVLTVAASCAALADDGGNRSGDGATISAQRVSAPDSNPARSTSPSELADKRIRVGVRDDAKPFSYRSATNDLILPQYRGYMVEICRRVLREMVATGPFAGYTVEAIAVDAADRFQKLADGELDMLCGPDSITAARLRHFAVSQPMFISGMTYGYLNPHADEFPRSRYCGNVVGVVRGTTAEISGLRMMVNEGVLLRFNEAVDRNLGLYPELRKQYAAARRELEDTHRRADRNDLSERQWIGYRQAKLDQAFGSVNKRLHAAIRTDECPDGFLDGLPIRTFENHDAGVAAFCAGKVLYYIGDYDIIKRKVATRRCDVVIERFTRTREVYGAFFRPGFHNAAMGFEPSAARSDTETAADFATDALLYTVFNHTLLRKMQSNINILEFEFDREFQSAEKSEDLLEFFQSFHIASDLSQTR